MGSGKSYISNPTEAARRTETEDLLRRINRSGEESRREREDEERDNGIGSSNYRDDEDEVML